jgi:integrase
VPVKDSEPDIRFLARYINPSVGDVRVDAFTLDEADQVMSSLPAGHSSSTRRHVAQVIRRVLALAVYPARYIRENPVPRGWLPKVRQKHAFTHLYPDQDARLMACTEVDEHGSPKVPLLRRLFFGILAREGLRRDELGGLRCVELRGRGRSWP